MDAFTVDLLARYTSQKEALGYAAKVLVREKAEARRFWVWAATQGCHHPLEVTTNLAADYQTHLSRHPDRKLQAETVRYKLGRLKRFYRWLHRQDLIAGNPFDGLSVHHRPRQYHRQPLTQAEIARLFAVPDVTTANGIRVRAILETFYSTGLREMELAGLGLYDVDQAQGWVRVFEGKFKQDRIVPIGESAITWVSRYLSEVRPTLLRGPETGHLFLSGKGRYYKYQGALSVLVRRYIDKAGIHRPGACHLLRHSAATHMLQHGADVRTIQAMLGHRCIRTTECYTHLECADLKKVQQRCHPWP